MSGSVRSDGPFAVVDIGSNSVRMVIYHALSRAPLVLFNEKALCGLARDLDRTGVLHTDGIDQALATLARFRRILRACGVEELEALATAAVRTARDGGDFLRDAEAVLGHPISLLSGREEAASCALGVLGGIADADGVVVDLGGGSIEFADLGPSGMIEPLCSLPIGSLLLVEALREGRFEQRILAPLQGCRKLAASARGRSLYLVGGTWRSLARIHLMLRNRPLRLVHGYRIDRSELLRFLARLRRMGRGQLENLPGVARKRLEVVPAAALMLREIVRIVDAERVEFAATGVREGRLFHRLEPEVRALDPLLVGADELAWHDARHGDFGAALFAWLGDLIPPLVDVPERIVKAACTVSDVGWREHPDTRARETFHRLVQYPFLGISHPQRVFLAYAVFRRYGGRREESVSAHLEYLDRDARKAARGLGEAMRLAHRMSGGRPELLHEVRLKRRQRLLELEAPADLMPPERSRISGLLRKLARNIGAEGTRIGLR